MLENFLILGNEKKFTAMKMMKLSFKKDNSARVTSRGSTPKNYTPTKVKMAKLTGKWSGGNARLGSGNNAKPEGTLPRMGNPSGGGAGARMQTGHY